MASALFDSAEFKKLSVLSLKILEYYGVTRVGQGLLVIFHVLADAIVDEHKELGHQARIGYTEIDRWRKLNVRRTRWGFRDTTNISLGQKIFQ